MWALPGGLVLMGKSVEQAVKRELKEEAGIDVNYLEQLYTFGDPDRSTTGSAISSWPIRTHPFRIPCGLIFSFLSFVLSNGYSNL